MVLTERSSRRVGVTASRTAVLSRECGLRFTAEPSCRDGKPPGRHGTVQARNRLRSVTSRGVDPRSGSIFSIACGEHPI